MLDTFQVDMSQQFPSNTTLSLVIGMAQQSQTSCFNAISPKNVHLIEKCDLYSRQGVTEFGIHYRLESCVAEYQTKKTELRPSCIRLQVPWCFTFSVLFDVFWRYRHQDEIK